MFREVNINGILYAIGSSAFNDIFCLFLCCELKFFLSVRPSISTIVSSNSLLTCISILIFIHARVKCQFGPLEREEKGTLTISFSFYAFALFMFARKELTLRGWNE